MALGSTPPIKAIAKAIKGSARRADMRLAYINIAMTRKTARHSIPVSIET
jgi:hypothetical protein